MKISRVKKNFILLLIILFQLTVFSKEKNSKSISGDELFYKANQLYKEGKFENALNTYLEILSTGRGGGNLYYNMGNTCYRLNMTGQAILYYEKARIYMPRDPDLDYNLRYVRKLAKDAVDTPSDAISGILFWTDSMTRGELFALLAIIHFILFSALSIRIFIKKEWTYYLPAVLLILWLAAGASFGWKYYIEANDNRAVVLADEVDVLSGPDAGDTLLFKLHTGAVVRQNGSEEEWKLISLPDGKRGWVKADSIEIISVKN